MTTHQIGPRTTAADSIHAMKYRGPNEDFEEAINRIAFGLADGNKHYFALRDVLLPQRFCPGGRIQGAIGATRQTTSFNCYVSGTIFDSLVDGDGSIMDRLKEAAATSKLGGGIGYDFSTIRPKGDRVRRIETDATGPVSFMEFFNTVGLGVASSGHRRGAQMAILRVDHPDIEEFVRAKQRPGVLEGFNVSVAVTDAFMEAVYSDGLFVLKFGGTSYRDIRAVDLWQKIMRATWDWAEPGVFFVDTVNRMNNLYYCETIAATNPCVVGETMIEVAGRGPVTIKKLASEGKSIPVFAVDPKTGEIVVRMGRNPRKTGQKRKLVKVMFDDGSFVRVTPDHRFPLRNGKKVEAKNLKRGDSLFRFDTSITKQDGVSIGLGDSRRVEYHLIAEAKYGKRFKFGRRKGEVNVHHLNEDHFDNSWNNIEVEEVGAHSSLHKSGDGNPMRFWWNDLSEKEKEAYRAKMSASTRGEKNGMHGRKHSAETLKKIGKKTRERFRDSGFRQTHSAAVTAAMSKMEPEVRARNHKVVSVEDGGVADVYNITVDEFHNYAVSTSEGKSSRGNPTRSGVFVCNCGEQPLPPFGACLLGSYNLPKYLIKNPAWEDGVHISQTSEPPYYFDYDLLRADAPVVVRGMDKVVDVSRYPLEAQAVESRNKRRMGLGVMGLANALEAMGHPYGSPGFLAEEAKILSIIRDESYRASANLAGEKGAFPLFESEKYLAGEFIKTLPDDIRDLIAKNGIRNSHLTSIAPTGTIAMAADNVSSGIEPVFAYDTIRQINTPNGKIETTISDYGSAFLGVRGKLSADVTADEHVNVLTTSQRFVDSAVSKTCNVTGNLPWDDFVGIYEKVYRGGGKGCTTFNSDGRRVALLTAAAVSEDGLSCAIDDNGHRSCE